MNRQNPLSPVISLVILMLFFSIFLGCVLDAGNAGLTENLPDGDKSSWDLTVFSPPLTKRTSREDILGLVTGGTYYLDAVAGSDSSGDGSSAKPWASLAKVRAVLQSGDCAVLRSGNYGTFGSTAVYGKPTVYIADTGHTPVFTNVRLRDNDSPNHMTGNPSSAYKTNLVFYGIRIEPAWVDPGTTDPMYVNATASTYKKCTYGIDLKWYGTIKFINCSMSPSPAYGVSKKFLSVAAVSLVNAPDVWIEDCDIDSFNSGIDYTGAPGLRVYYNKIHGVAGGMISNKDGLSLGAVIEGNHLFDSNWAVTDPYCPRRSVDEHYHGSFMSVRGCDTVVRNNIMHGGCNSSGMMLYDDMRAPFDNILIEGNQIYDSNNVYALRLYNVNSNVIVRNNTLIGKGRYGQTDGYKYNTALAFHSFFGTKAGKRLFIYNNVIVGRLGLPDNLDAVELGGNVVYSASFPLPAGNLTGYGSGHDFFETAFFADALDVSWQNWEADGEGFANPHGHGKTLDLSLDSDSPALGFGIADWQAPTRITGLDGNGFLNLAGVHTDFGHSAGAME